MSQSIEKQPLHDTIGYFDLKYLMEDMIECNKKVICEKCAKEWYDQSRRDSKRVLTQVCVNGDEGHKQCGYAKCECHCHHGQTHDGQYWWSKGEKEKLLQDVKNGKFAIKN